MWDDDDVAVSSLPYDMIDEFIFNFTEAAGPLYTTLNVSGVRPSPKT